MAMRWLGIFQQGNNLAKAHAQRAVDEHANPKDLLALSIEQLRDDHANLEQASAQVIAQYNQAKDRLERDIAHERQLDLQGQAATRAGHKEAAAAIAHQLVSIRGIIATEKAGFEQLQAAADKAKAAFAENTAMLTAKLEEAKQLEAEIDQAAVQHNINAAMDAVTSMSRHTIPSFDQVRDRVHADAAREAAHAELQGTNPDITAIHEEHLVQLAAADDVMSAWETPAVEAPAAKRPPIRTTATVRPTGSKSAIDRLNE